MKKVISLSRSGASIVSRQAGDIASGVLRSLFEAAGAVYNTSTGFYELNGLCDLTEEQMLPVFALRHALLAGDNLRAVACGASVRTLFPCSAVVGVRFAERAVDAARAFAGSAVEVVKFGAGQAVDSADDDNVMPVRSIDGAFSGCSALRVVYPIDLQCVQRISDETFAGCTALEEVRLRGLSASLDISQSPALSFASISYIVCRASGGGDIVITLHPVVYGSLQGMVAAPGDWETLRVIAEHKRVGFATTYFIAFARDGVVYVSSPAVQNGVFYVPGDNGAVLAGELSIA